MKFRCMERDNENGNFRKRKCAWQVHYLYSSGVQYDTRIKVQTINSRMNKLCDKGKENSIALKVPRVC